MSQKHALSADAQGYGELVSRTRDVNARTSRLYVANFEGYTARGGGITGRLLGINASNK